MQSIFALGQGRSECQKLADSKPTELLDRPNNAMKLAKPKRRMWHIFYRNELHAAAALQDLLLGHLNRRFTCLNVLSGSHKPAEQLGFLLHFECISISLLDLQSNTSFKVMHNLIRVLYSAIGQSRHVRVVGQMPTIHKSLLSLIRNYV